MCGRFSLGLHHQDIQQMDGYEVQIGEWINEDQFHPRHNVAPRSQAPVIRRRRDGPGSSSRDAQEGNSAVILHTMKWGLVPHWSKHEDTTLNTINARGESLVEGTGMWRSLRSRMRCAIPCEGYYEWLKKGKERLPHFTKRKDGKLLLLAGLYDCVTLEGQSEPLFTFTIVTTDASKEFSWLHDRQPVMLSTTEALQTWLDTTNHQWDSTIVDLIQPYHDNDAPLTCYQVPKEVGKIGTESPTFIEPISERKDGIQAMFAKQANKAAGSSTTTTPTSSQAQTEPTTPFKRKRSSSLSPMQASRSSGKRKSGSINETEGKAAVTGSPQKEVIDLCDDDTRGLETDGQDEKLEKMNAWEDDGVEYLDVPSSSQKCIEAHEEKPPLKKSKVQDSRRVPSSPKKATKSSTAGGSAKITSFFTREKH